MAFKTVRAHPEIIRRLGLGAQQCQDCGTVYKDTEIPKACDNGECPTNRQTMADDVLQTGAYRYHLTEVQGKAVRTYLKMYSCHFHRIGAREEGDHAWELAKLFE